VNRWLALVLALFGGALAAWFGAMGAFAMLYGVLWIFVFGDSPWPDWVDAVLPVLLLVFAAGVFLVTAWLIWRNLRGRPAAG